MPIHLNNTNKSLLKSFIWLTVKELKIPFMNPPFLQTQNEDYGNSDNIKVNPFMNSFFFFICWNSEKCQWLEFRSLRCLCYSLAGPFSTTRKDKNPEFILEHSTLGSSNGLFCWIHQTFFFLRVESTKLNKIETGMNCFKLEYTISLTLSSSAFLFFR